MGESKMTFVLCDGTLKNSHGFRTLVSGIGLERFERNPVMLYGHDSYGIDSVIGRWNNVRVEGSKLLADAEFDTEDEMGRRVAGKVERGFLKGCSMGIHVIEFMDVDGEEVCTRCELMEASVCAIPSDAGAVRLYDGNRKELTYEEVRLELYKPKSNEKMKEEPNKTTAEDAALQAKDAEIAQLKAELAEGRKREIDNYLSAAVASGKIAETEKAHYAKLSEQDFATVKTLLDAKPQKATASLRDLEPRHNGSDGRESWNYLAWMKKDPEGLKRMKREDPNRFAELQKTI